MPPMPPPLPKPKKKRTGLKVAIIISSIVIVLGGGFFGYSLFQKNAADTAYEQRDYEGFVSAVDMAPWLTFLEDVEDNYDYSSARLHEQNEEWELALEKYEGLEGYEDSAERIDGINYHIADEMAQSGEYEQALEIFDSLGSYGDSADRANAIRYDMAYDLLMAGDYDGALQAFMQLGSYRDSEEMMYNIDAYQLAHELTDSLDRYYAFSILGDFLDSAELAAAEASGVYERAIDMYFEGNFGGAYDTFSLISEYGDVSFYITACEVADNYTQGNLETLVMLEEAGIYVGHILLSTEYYRGYWDGAWSSSDGGGNFTYDMDERQFDFEDFEFGGGNFTYDSDITTLVPDDDGIASVVFNYIDFNTMEIVVGDNGTFTYRRN